MDREQNVHVQVNTKEYSPKKMQEFLSSECISTSACTRRPGPNLRKEFAKSMLSLRYYTKGKGFGLNSAILDTGELT